MLARLIHLNEVVQRTKEFAQFAPLANLDSKIVALNNLCDYTADEFEFLVERFPFITQLLPLTVKSVARLVLNLLS